MLTEIQAPGASRGVLLLLAVALVLGILSALRWPEGYTVSQMVIDYHFGFGKRGLIGLLLEWVNKPPYHYKTLAFMAFGIFVIWVVLLAALSWPLVRNDTGVAACLILFFLSIGFSSLVCDIGRGEHFGLALCLTCLLMPRGLPWIVARALMLVAAALMQEVNFVIFAPLVAFDAWIGEETAPERQTSWRVVAMLLPATVLTWHLGNLRTACDVQGATAFFQQHMAADFEVQWRPVATLCNDAAANMDIVNTFMWGVSTNAVLVPLTFLVVLPLTLFYLLLTLRLLPNGMLARMACLGAVFAPVALIIVAADVVRFMTLIQLTSLLVLLSTIRRLGLSRGPVIPRSWSGTVIVLLLVAFQLGSALPLNDGSAPLRFPFEPLVQRAIAVIQGRAPFVVITR